ncbi:MAG: ribosomal subunit interface protein [Robiginitomaculum sp.]|nr:MAG: ribosomal subunit interface protein [Robiginitomaculum sp.]
MIIQVVNKGIDVSEALRTRITERVSEGVEKYFNRPSEAFIVITRDGKGFRVECSLHLPSGIVLHTHGQSVGDAYAAADEATIKLEKRLRRYKRKLRNHHKGNRGVVPAEDAPLFVLEAGRNAIQSLEDHDDAEAEEAGLEEKPAEAVIIAEKTAELRTMSVSMAVMEMDTTDASMLLFRNLAHGELNAVYRRPDGHIGWLNPGQGQA